MMVSLAFAVPLSGLLGRQLGRMQVMATPQDLAPAPIILEARAERARMEDALGGAVQVSKPPKVETIGLEQPA